MTPPWVKPVITGGLIALAAAFAIPLCLGIWDPSWLRLAGTVEVDTSVGSTVELGEVEAPFRVSQRSADGAVLWTLTGDRLERTGGGLYSHEIVDPALTFYRAGEVFAEVRAKRGRLLVPLPNEAGPSEGPEDDPDRPTVRIDLQDDVVLRQTGRVTLRTDRITLETSDDEKRRMQPGGFVARGDSPLSVTVEDSAAPGAPWRLDAQGVRAVLVPLRIDLAGPVAFRSGQIDPAGGGPLAGQALEGLATGGVTIEEREGVDPNANEHPGAKALPLPVAWSLTGHGVQVTGRGTASSSFKAGRVHLTFKKTPSSARVSLGGLSGTSPAWTYALASGRALEGVEAEIDRGEVAPTSSATPIHVGLVADALSMSEDGRLEATGAPARLTDLAADRWIEAALLRVRRGSEEIALSAEGSVRFRVEQVSPSSRKTRTAEWEGEATSLALTLDPSVQSAGGDRLATLRGVRSLEAHGTPVVMRDVAGKSVLRVPTIEYRKIGELGSLRFAGGLDVVADGVERGRRAAPWRVTARQATAQVELSELAAPPEARDWKRTLRAAAVRGEVRVTRQGDPADLRRRRELRGDQLTWSSAERRALLLGAGATGAQIAMGRTALEAKSIAYGADTGRLDANGGLRLLTSFPARKADGEETTLEVRAQRGYAVLDPDPAAWKAHRLRRKEARRAGERTELLPQPLGDVELFGGQERLVLSGSRGVHGEADRFVYRSATREGALETRDGTPPLKLGFEGLTLTARRCLLRREEGVTHVRGEGKIRVSGAATPTRPRLDLSAGWVSAELFDPPPGKRSADAPPPPSSLGAFSAGGERGVHIDIERPSAKDPAQRRRAALVADRVEGEGRHLLPDGRYAVLLRLPGPWRSALTLKKKGLARVSGGRAVAIVDPATASAGPRKGESEEAYVRRLLHSFEARDGIELSASGLQVRGQEADLDAAGGTYELRGDPAVLSREGLSQEASVLTVRLSDE